jgi:hypothetical protein
MSGVLSLIRAPAVAFIGAFLVVGGWFWAPQLSRLMPGFSSSSSSASSSIDSGGSWFAGSNRLGRPETAPVLRTCIARMVDFGRRAEKIEPGAVYSMLKAGSMQASMSALAGRSDPWTGNQTVMLAASWGELASCIYAQDDRELCDPDNRAAMVEATTKFFAFTKQTETSKPPISARDAQVLSNFGDRLSNALKNHRRYGTLVASDFGSLAPPEITRIMSEEKQTREICKR